MTIAEIAAQMSVAPETLVQEVCKQQTEMAMLTAVCGVAFAVIAINFIVISFTYDPIFAALFAFPCLLANLLHLWKPVDTEIPHPPMICV